MGTLAHLLDPAFTPLAALSLEELIGAQATTASALFDLDDNAHVLSALDRTGAQEAFAAITNPEADPKQQKAAVLNLRVPEAVKHLSGMLTQYDWAFVEQAKEIRGYVVAQLLEETKNPDARIRLKALELTGKLTEVGSFMERITVTKTDASSEELTARIRDRLSKMIPPAREVQDARIIEVPPPAPFGAPTQES
jgi:hypothetical protein